MHRIASHRSAPTGRETSRAGERSSGSSSKTKTASSSALSASPLGVPSQSAAGSSEQTTIAAGRPNMT
eukprot:2715254-Heterocapsa_arctica.AAC.1